VGPYPSVMSSSILLKLRSQLHVRYLDVFDQYSTDSVLFTTLLQLNFDDGNRISAFSCDFDNILAKKDLGQI
jgi:hypothetical protein